MMQRFVAGSATAAMVLAATASGALAQNEYGTPQNPTVNVSVEKIAVLNVPEGGQTCSMTVDDTNDDFMGQDSGSGSSFDADDLCTVTLKTNFTVDALKVDFPRRGSIAGDNNVYGKATNGDGDILGVWPQVGYIENGAIKGGGGGILAHDGTNTPLELTGPTRDSTAGFPAGTHRFGLGVSTKWTKTPDGGPEFAEPGVYTIDLTTTIVPELAG